MKTPFHALGVADVGPPTGSQPHYYFGVLQFGIWGPQIQGLSESVLRMLILGSSSMHCADTPSPDRRRTVGEKPQQFGLTGVCR